MGKHTQFGCCSSSAPAAPAVGGISLHTYCCSPHIGSPGCCSELLPQHPVVPAAALSPNPTHTPPQKLEATEASLRAAEKENKTLTDKTIVQKMQMKHQQRESAALKATLRQVGLSYSLCTGQLRSALSACTYTFIQTNQRTAGVAALTSCCHTQLRIQEDPPTLSVLPPQHKQIHSHKQSLQNTNKHTSATPTLVTLHARPTALRRYALRFPYRDAQREPHHITCCR